MSSRHLILWGAIMLLFATALGYYGYRQYVQILASTQLDAARVNEVNVNRARLASALGNAGVSPVQASSGFWYTYTDAYGTQSVFYFDPYQWSQQSNLTDSQIASLVAIVASSSLTDISHMHDVPEKQLPSNLQFHNRVYANPIAPNPAYQSTKETLEALYAKGEATAEQLWELSYLYELQGDYAKRDEVNTANCAKYQQRCAGNIQIRLTGKVTDLAGRPIQGASVTVLSRPGTSAATTDASGEYSITLRVLPMEKIRVSAVKRNFTNGVASIVVLGAGKGVYIVDTIVLTSPIRIITLDTKNHTVTDPADSANPDGSFVLNATSSSYQIPSGAIVHTDGTPYSGPVDVYIYEFTRDTVPQSLTSLDTFNEVIGYAGNLMQTLGMPYIQFFTPSGETLAVMKSKPMLLTYKIPGMQDMLTNFYKRPEGPLTQNQLQTILAASAGDPGFPITAGFLAKYKISTFPAFWVLDQSRGVWENQGMRLLDAQGTMQAPFYTINNI